MSVLDPSNIEDTRDKNQFIPLKVTAYMEKPVVSFGDGLALDGPLQWAAYQMHADKKNLPDPNHEWAVDFAMPVGRWTFDGGQDQPMDELDDRALSSCGHLWGWCVSNAQAEWLYNDKTHVRKKEPSDFIKRWSGKKSVNTVSGQYKSGNKPYPIKFAERIHWYLLANPDSIGKYLDKITHLGKLANHGWGKIQCDRFGLPRWHVTETKKRWDTRNDTPIARLPYKWNGIEQSPSLMSMRAPRWDHRRHAMMMRGQNVCM